MTLRTFSLAKPCLLLLLLCLSASGESDRPQWRYFPTNSNLASGLVFFFGGRTGPSATITVVSEEAGETATTTKEADIDPTVAGRVFVPMKIHNLDHLTINSIKVVTSGLAKTVKTPTAGTLYEM